MECEYEYEPRIIRFLSTMRTLQVFLLFFFFLPPNEKIQLKCDLFDFGLVCMAIGIRHEHFRLDTSEFVIQYFTPLWHTASMVLVKCQQ